MSGIATHLGQKSAYKKVYDPELLVREPRQANRTYLGLEDGNLPFDGFDMWNAYEVSALNDNGLPYSFVLKIVYPATGKYIVESKSLKLYYNSYAMTQLGATVEEVKAELVRRSQVDLGALLEVEVKVGAWTQREWAEIDQASVSEIYELGSFFETLETVEGIDDVVFNDYSENPNLLKFIESDGVEEYGYHSSCLVSCCKVTSQPDSGDIVIVIKGKRLPTKESLLQYLVSFRNENHFHEEICEAIIKRLIDLLEPESIGVACFYSRRGGIDINPIRWYNLESLATIEDVTTPHYKFPRQ